VLDSLLLDSALAIQAARGLVEESVEVIINYLYGE
jgi:hypothetical protein